MEPQTCGWFSIADLCLAMILFRGIFTDGSQRDTKECHTRLVGSR